MCSIFTCDVWDAGVLQEIHNSSFDEKWSLDQFIGIFGNKIYKVFKYVLNNRTIGFIMLRAVFDEVEVIKLCTCYEARSHGVGSCLLEHSIKCYSTTSRSMFLEVNVTNVNALNLYRKFGFRTIGVRDRYYCVNGISYDAYVMWLCLKRECDFV